jgi:DNA polymerase III subunit chi
MTTGSDKDELVQVDFYQLGARTVEQALPAIAQKVIDSGERLLVVSSDDRQRARLDAALWNYRPESFLPHAQAGADDDAAQPVLLSAAPDPANTARHIAFIDGQWRDEALNFERAFHFFDVESVEAARVAWRALGSHENVERRYWSQDDDGKWSRMA